MKIIKTLILIKTIVLILLLFSNGCRFNPFIKKRTGNPNLDTNQQFIPFRKGGKWGFCDKNKKILIEPVYDSAAPFFEGISQVGLGRKDGFIDKTGREITDFKYNG